MLFAFKRDIYTGFIQLFKPMHSEINSPNLDKFIDRWGRIIRWIPYMKVCMYLIDYGLIDEIIEFIWGVMTFLKWIEGEGYKNWLVRHIHFHEKDDHSVRLWPDY